MELLVSDNGRRREWSLGDSWFLEAERIGSSTRWWIYQIDEDDLIIPGTSQKFWSKKEALRAIPK